ncbi:MAG: SAM-dependent methyltransferase [Candidatus Latescibacterota bacterium]|jgi:SAM-dependent methyltransferase
MDELLSDIYQRRLGNDTDFRQRMYKVLCQNVFQKYIPKNATVLDLAAGYCEFINNIQAANKIAVDLNPDTQQHAAPHVKTIITRTTDLSAINDNTIDAAFTSNFFEHLSKPDIVQTIQETHRVLKPNGRFLILQPNIRYCSKDYWMFFDHITPIDHDSLSEVLEIHNFKIDLCIPRFLPYSTKGRLPNSIWLLKLYLRLPLVKRIFGKQLFICARKVASPEKRS